MPDKAIGWTGSDDTECFIRSEYENETHQAAATVRFHSQ